MKIELPWGNETLVLNVPKTWTIQYPKPAGAVKKETGTEIGRVRTALKKSVGCPPLEKLKLRGKKVVLVVDDNTRPTPAYKFFNLILDDLEKAGASMKNVVLIPGLGIHTPMTEAEMAEKVGAHNLKRITWENHDAFNGDKNHYFGTTRHGTPVYLNSHLADAGLIVLIGMVEPHLWAGFGGGLKNILPGLAHAETISAHHSIIAEPPYLFNRVGMTPEKNMFRTDLEEIHTMISAPIFCINVIIDHENTITTAFAGDPVAIHRDAVAFNIAAAGRILDRQVDAVITNSHPMNINFKQSMKCVGNTLPAVKPGGAVIALMRAERGVDDITLPADSKPLWLVKTILRALGPSRVMGFLERVRKGVNVEEKFLLYYSMQLMRQYNLYFCAPTLSDDEVRRMGFFVHSRDPQEIIDIAARKIGKDAVVAVFPEGGATFPILADEQ